MLDRAATAEVGGALLSGDATQVGLRFLAAATNKSGPNRLHLHVTSTSAEDQQQTIERVLDLGGRHLDVGQLPDEEHVVLADPEGNEFCVIEPGNRFLAGCGRLGEVACDGTRIVGLFWRDVSTGASCGTKGGDGGPVAVGAAPRSRGVGRLSTPGSRGTGNASTWPRRISTQTLAALVALGATRLGERDGGVELADPDGNEFWVSTA